MQLRAPLVVAGLVLGLAVTAPQVRAAKGVKKKGDHWVHGTVIHVEHRANNTGEITVKVHHARKKIAVVAGQPAAHHHRLLVGPQTQFAIKAGQMEKATTFAAVRKGEHVSVLARTHHADKVVIHRHHLKKPVPTRRKGVLRLVR